MSWHVRRVTWCQTLVLTSICALLSLAIASQLPCFVGGKIHDNYCVFGKASAVSVLATCAVGFVPLMLAVLAAFKRDLAAVHPVGELERLVTQEQGYRSSGYVSEQGEMAALAANRVNKSRTFLYVGHFFSAWSDRMWQFLVPVVFMDIFVESLMPSAVFGLSIYAFTVVAMPFLGKWLDHTPRRFALILSIAIENLALVGSTVLLGYMLVLQKPHLANKFGLSSYMPSAPSPSVRSLADALEETYSSANVSLAKSTTDTTNIWTPTMTACFVGVIVFGVIAEVNNQAQTIAVEKDWVNVLARVLGGEVRGALSPAHTAQSHGHSHSSRGRGSSVQSHSHNNAPVDVYPISPAGSLELGKLNRTLRRIDLSCKVLAPALSGKRLPLLSLLLSVLGHIYICIYNCCPALVGYVLDIRHLQAT
jgi:hypothetical protein